MPSMASLARSGWGSTLTPAAWSGSAIAAQAGWSEAAITKMVQTYGHAVDERRLDEIDWAFERDADRDAGPA